MNHLQRFGFAGPAVEIGSGEFTSWLLTALGIEKAKHTILLNDLVSVVRAAFETADVCKMIVLDCLNLLQADGSTQKSVAECAAKVRKSKVIADKGKEYHLSKDGVVQVWYLRVLVVLIRDILRKDVEVFHLAPVRSCKLFLGVHSKPQKPKPLAWVGPGRAKFATKASKAKRAARRERPHPKSLHWGHHAFTYVDKRSPAYAVTCPLVSSDHASKVSKKAGCKRQRSFKGLELEGACILDLEAWLIACKQCRTRLAHQSLKIDDGLRKLARRHNEAPPADLLQERPAMAIEQKCDAERGHPQSCCLFGDEIFSGCHPFDFLDHWLSRQAKSRSGCSFTIFRMISQHFGQFTTFLMISPPFCNFCSLMLWRVGRCRGGVEEGSRRFDET